MDGAGAGVLLALVSGPLLVGLVVLPIRLGAGSGPSCCGPGSRGRSRSCSGTYLLSSGVPDANRLYGVVFVVVTFSVVVQGGLVPTVARLCGLRLTPAAPG